MHRRNPPYRKKTSSYFLPFVVIIIGILIVYFAFQLFFGSYSGLFGGSKEETYFYIETGSAEVLFSEQDKWHNALDGVKLFEGESIRTDRDSRAKLLFADKTIIRLDDKTEIYLSELSSSENDNSNVVQVNSGQIWAKVQYTANKDSGTIIESPLVKVLSRGGVFALEENTVRVIDGKVMVSILNNGEVLDEVEVGIGQELTVNDLVIESIKNEEEVRLLAALSDHFKQTDWYSWNKMKDDRIFTYDDAESEKADEGADETGEEGEDAEETGEEGAEEEESEEEEEPMPLSAPEVNDPTLENNEATITDSTVLIKGTVGKDIEKVVVNNYTLSKFVEGSGVWQYRASADLGNLEKGKNEYKIYGEDKKGNKTPITKITIHYGDEDTDEEEDEDDEEEEEDTNDRTDTLGLAITKPSTDGKYETKEKLIMIEGTASKETEYVKVNGYRLSAYKAGDKNWLYRASTELGNLEAGENTYTVITYDENDKKIDEAEMTIVHESEEEPESDTEEDQAEESETDTPSDEDTEEPPAEEPAEEEEADALTTPTITMPSSNGVYETTLDTVVIGGSCSSSTVILYVNNEPITFVSGSTKWKKTIKLNEGENTFQVMAEDTDGKTSGVNTITITYTGT